MVSAPVLYPDRYPGRLIKENPTISFPRPFRASPLEKGEMQPGGRIIQAAECGELFRLHPSMTLTRRLISRCSFAWLVRGFVIFSQEDFFWDKLGFHS
jgi:hypothetical protein